MNVSSFDIAQLLSPPCLVFLGRGIEYFGDKVAVGQWETETVLSRRVIRISGNSSLQHSFRQTRSR
jgi:hypothetical protein